MITSLSRLLYARKWIAHEKYQNKSQDSTENSCRKFKVLEICPKSIIETDCKGNEFFCHQSKSCLDTAKICDGIVLCILGEDKAIELCKSTFPGTVTVQCKEIDRGSYDISILATPCNGIQECSDRNLGYVPNVEIFHQSKDVR